jgi:hypothetical protein
LPGSISGIWDNAEVFLYPDEERYLKATGAAAWKGACAAYSEKEVSNFIWVEMFFDISCA